MKRYIVHLIFILIPLFTSLTLSAQEKEQPPVGGEPKDFKIPERETVELDNGITLVMVEYGIVPKATVSLVVSTGRVHETSEENYLATLVGNFMQEGTTSMDAKAVNTAFAKMGGQLNVAVGTHQSTISAPVLSEFAADGVRTIADVAQHPAFPASELERLKTDMKRNFSVARTQPQTQATQEFLSTFYGDHPYGRKMPEDAAVESFTLQQVKDFYSRNFGAKRSKLYVVGKFDKAAVKAAFKESFSEWAAGADIAYEAVKPQPAKDAILLDRPNSPQATILFGLPVVDPSNEDYQTLDVMNSLLGGSFGSRVTSNIREDKGYTYSPFSTVANRYGSAIWYQQADVTIENTADALKEIVYEMDRLRKEAPSPEELEGIKNYEAGIFVLQNSSPNGIIFQLAFMDLYGLDDDYLNNQVKNIHAVTPEQVREMAEKYIRPEDMLLVVVGDKKQTVPQIEAFKKAEIKYEKMID